MVETVVLVTTDEVNLEAELSVAAAERARVVLCHPHPLHGGTMRSLVTSELFRELPTRGITCLRFNFRGVGTSGGIHDQGDGERQDAEAALGVLAAGAETPVFVAGWSFGADVAVSIQDRRHSGWIAIAGPLAYAHDLGRTAADPRPKLVLLAEHDEVRPAADVASIASAWTAATVVTIPGASHFFVGRTAQLVDQVDAWIGLQVDGRSGGAS